MERAYRPARVRQMQGQNPEETGGVYADIRRGFPKGDNEAGDVLINVARGWNTLIGPQEYARYEAQPMRQPQSRQWRDEDC